MKKIALIVINQIESIYLQRLIKSDLYVFIKIVESFQSSREIAKQSFEIMLLNEKTAKIDFLFLNKIL